MKKKHIIITGIVTGVGFRWWLKTKAKERNIYGWVKNKSKNQVEAVLFGNEKDVEDMIELCRNGPDSSDVKDVEIKDYQQENFKESFDIL